MSRAPKWHLGILLEEMPETGVWYQTSTIYESAAECFASLYGVEPMSVRTKALTKAEPVREWDRWRHAMVVRPGRLPENTQGGLVVKRRMKETLRWLELIGILDRQTGEEGRVRWRLPMNDLVPTIQEWYVSKGYTRDLKAELEEFAERRGRIKG